MRDSLFRRSSGGAGPGCPGCLGDLLTLDEMFLLPLMVTC